MDRKTEGEGVGVDQTVCNFRVGVDLHHDAASCISNRSLSISRPPSQHRHTHHTVKCHSSGGVVSNGGQSWTRGAGIRDGGCLCSLDLLIFTAANLKCAKIASIIYCQFALFKTAGSALILHFLGSPLCRCYTDIRTHIFFLN